MADSFFEQLKPVNDSSWIAGLQSQRALTLEKVKQGTEMLRTGTPQEQAIGASLLGEAGIQVPMNAAPSEFSNVPQFAPVQSAAPMAGPVPQAGQQGFNEARFYQDQGASAFDAAVKKAGIQQDAATGDYFRWGPGGKVNANEEAARLSGGLGLATPSQSIAPTDINRKIEAQTGTGAPINTYEDSIAKAMGISRGTAGMENLIQQQKDTRDTASAQSVANQKTRAEFNKTPLMSKIRSHAFSQTSSPAQAFGIGMDTIDKLESQGSLSPQDAKEMRDNFVMSFNDETFTGTKGAGTGHYYQEKLKQRRGGGGSSPGATDSVEIFNAAGDLKTRRLAVPKEFAGNVHFYANSAPTQFIEQYTKTFDTSPDEKKDMIAWVQGSGKYKGQGPKNITQYPPIARNLELTGKSSAGAIPIGATEAENKQYADLIKTGKSPDEAKAAVWGGTGTPTPSPAKDISALFKK